MCFGCKSREVKSKETELQERTWQSLGSAPSRRNCDWVKSEGQDFGPVWMLGGRKMKIYLGAMIPLGSDKEVLQEHQDVGAPSPTDLLQLRAFSKTCQSTIETLASMALHLHTQPCSQIPHPSPDSSLTFLS